MNGVIWSKTQKTFVPISSVPMYAMIQKERLRQSRALEGHNFQLQNLTLASFQQEQYLVHFYDNNMMITGFCGEIWNLLSESLNFTLQLVKANLDDQGVPQKDASSFKNGLLPIIFRNETIVIAKLQSFSPELIATEFSIPFWTNRIQLYIHRETIYDNIWMVKIFSWKIWCVILSMINEDPFLQAKQMERLILASTFEDMHKKACFSKKEKYVIFQTEAMHKAVGNRMCHLTNVGKPYVKIWITSGIVKNFKYKRSIDLGILKLMEIGLLNVLKKRWLESGFKYYSEDETPKPIELHQVSLIIAVMCCGTIIALIIFIIEKILYLLIN
ncbi:GRIK4 protein, partial [Pseudoatta argentina]